MADGTKIEWTDTTAMAWCFIFHRWGQWIDKGETKSGILLQERRCLRCGKASRRTTGPLFDDGDDWEKPQ